jgi:phospho-N-acetylmuramoyl-pentapeptide-transferase
MVESNSLTEKKFNLSGTQLLIILGFGLSAAAWLLDWQNQALWQWTRSLLLPFWTSAALAGAVGYGVVPLLRALKAGQFIREDGPQAHLQKAGTPTMGGIFFIPVGAVVAVIWAGFTLGAIAVAALTLAYGFIGWLDDWQVLRRKSNKGISPRTKLALQIGFGVLFCLWLLWSQPSSITTVALPFNWTLPLGLLFWPLAGFVLVAESNATNLTDGVDGLAGGTVAIALLGLAALTVSTHPDLAIFCAALSGACLGFLVHNRNPAQVFMGDTGSLALGGALAAVALLSNTLFGLLILGGVFLIETLSVITQVLYYKATKGPDGVGKRLFKMAPFHHHLELSGWTETQVVGMFYLIGALLVGLSLVLYQLLVDG